MIEAAPEMVDRMQRLLSIEDVGMPVMQVRLQRGRNRLLCLAANSVHRWSWDKDEGAPVEKLSCWEWSDDSSARLLWQRDFAWAGKYSHCTSEWITDFSFDPANDEHFWLICKNRPPELRRVTDGELIKRAAGPNGDYGICLASTGNVLLYTAQGGHEDSVVYDTVGDRVVATFWDRGRFALHPEGKLIAAARSEQMGGDIRFLRLVQEGIEAFRIEVSTPTEVDGLAFSPSGDALAFVGLDEQSSLTVVEFPSCKVKFEILTQVERTPDEIEQRDFHWTEQALFTPDSRCVIYPNRLSGKADGDILFLDVDSGEVVSKVAAHSKLVTTLDIDYSTSRLVSGSKDGSLHVWRFPGSPAPIEPAKDKPITRWFVEHAEQINPRDYEPFEDECPSTLPERRQPPARPDQGGLWPDSI